MMINLYMRQFFAISIVIIVNALLFTILPSLHGAIIGMGNKNSNRGPVRMIAEITPPKKEEKKQIKKQIREVRSSSQQNNNERLSLKFTPDLGVAGDNGVALDGDNFQNVIYEDGQADEDAVPIQLNEPKYPSEAAAQNITGTVIAVFVINEQGAVESVEIIQSPHTILSETVRSTIKTWRFKPGKNKGMPVKIRKKVPLNFNVQ